MNPAARSIIVRSLRAAATSIEAARRQLRGNQSVFARLGYLATELRFTADAFAGDKHAKA